MAISFSPWVRDATPTMTNAASMHAPDLRAAFASVRAGVLTGPAASGRTAVGRTAAGET